MLNPAWMVPRKVVRHDPREHDYADSHESKPHSNGLQIVRTHHNVVHVARKSSHHDQSHVYDQECQEAEHRQEMDRTAGLPATEYLCVPLKPVDHRWRHRYAGSNRKRTEYKHHREIG